MSDTHGPLPRDDSNSDAQQTLSSKEPFPPLSDAPLDKVSSPQAAVAAATGTPVSATEPRSNTVVWLPPSQYDAIKDKWQDQFIWQPTAFASDLPVNQTSFIGVNRSRENSAAAHSGVLAGRVPAARTLGDISEGPNKADKGKEGDNRKEGHQSDSDEEEEEDEAHDQAALSSSPTANTQRSRPSPEAARKKFAQRRPVKTKQWHSFHLLKDPDPAQHEGQNQSTSSVLSGEVINVPDLPQQDMKPSKQTDKGKNSGKIPVLVPEPRDSANKQKDSSPRDADRHSKQNNYSSHTTKNDAGPSSSRSTRNQAHHQNSSFASTTPTLVAAEEAFQTAVQEQQDQENSSNNNKEDSDPATNAIIVAEMPENSHQRPRQALVLPTMAPNTISSPPQDTTGSDSIPSRSSTRRRRGRKKAATIHGSQSLEEEPLPWTPPQSSTGSSYSQYSHSPAPSSIAVSDNYASSSTGVSRRPTRRSASQRPSVFEESVLFRDVDNHRRAMQVARTSTPPQQWSAISNNAVNNVRNSSNNNMATTRRERKSASPTLNTQNAPTEKQGGGFRVELQLNLEVEVQLKAKIHGDLTLSLFE